MNLAALYLKFKEYPAVFLSALAAGLVAGWFAAQLSNKYREEAANLKVLKAEEKFEDSNEKLSQLSKKISTLKKENLKLENQISIVQKKLTPNNKMAPRDQKQINETQLNLNKVTQEAKSFERELILARKANKALSDQLSQKNEKFKRDLSRLEMEKTTLSNQISELKNKKNHKALTRLATLAKNLLDHAKTFQGSSQVRPVIPDYNSLLKEAKLLLPYLKDEPLKRSPDTPLKTFRFKVKQLVIKLQR